MNRRKALRSIVRALVVLLACALFLSALYVRSSYPGISGARSVKGLRAEVDVSRDTLGIAHIRANSAHDLYFAQGYVHAQERLWQMEFQRHVAAGRLSELFGEEFISTDTFLRRMGLPEVSRLAVDNATGRTRSAIDAYVAGVNAFIASGVRPLELKLLGMHSGSWSAEDVGGVLALMAFDLGLNWEMEAVRQSMLEEAGMDRMREVLPPYGREAPPVVSSGAKQPSGGSDPAATISPVATLSEESEERWLTAERLTVIREYSSLAGLGPIPRGGSNSWVVGPDHSAEGVALLANDPHLGLGLPSLWYEMELQYGEEHWVRGFSIPGAPAIAVGYNRDVAWGLTNTADTQDLFLERRESDQGYRFELDGQWYEADLRTEELLVSGRDEPKEIEIVSTANGRLILEDPSLSVAWSARSIERSPFDAFLNMNAARDIYELRDALIDFEIPPQNVVFADRSGAIGFRTAGRIPARKSAGGLLPGAGWDSAHAMPDPVPFESLPELINPDSGYIATANHRVTGDAYPFRILSDTAPPSRMQRITDVIESGPAMSVERSMKLQTDWRNLHAEYWTPRFLDDLSAYLDAAGSHPSDVERKALSVLEAWKEKAEYGRSEAGPVIFSHWYGEIIERIFAPWLGDELYNEFLESGYLVFNSTDAVLDRENSLWIEGNREELVAGAFSTVIEELVARFGEDPNQWQWEDVQSIELSHTLSEVPGLGVLLSRGPYPYGGDHMTVGRAAYDLDDPFNVTVGAGIRMIVSLDRTPASYVAHAGGQSGHALHRWYADQFEAWREGRFRHTVHFSGKEEWGPGERWTMRLIPANEALSFDY